jgi:hypothetical protein
MLITNRSKNRYDAAQEEFLRDLEKLDQNIKATSREISKENKIE